MKMTRLWVVVEVGIVAMLIAACQTTPVIPEYDGANLYKGYCASCHGPSGAGDGPVASVLKPGMQDLRTISARNGGVFPQTVIDAIIDGSGMRPAHGSVGMPVWGRAFYMAESAMGEEEPEKYAAARIRALSDYLESIQVDR